MTWHVEYTDTFGGQANYAWVDRATLPERENESDRGVMMRARAEMGLTGVRGRTYWHGDTGEFRPRNSNTVLFVSYDPW